MTQHIHTERIKVDALCVNRDNPCGPLFRLEATADHQPPCASTRLPDGNGKRNNDHSKVLVSVVMPCLNEARTLAACGPASPRRLPRWNHSDRERGCQHSF